MPRVPAWATGVSRMENPSSKMEGAYLSGMTTKDISGFAGLGLDDRILDVLTQLGYEEPTPVQREAIPPLLEGKDVLGQAATGTGKTAAFALPLLQNIGASTGPSPAVRALVLVPTRELAMQVAEAIHRSGKGLGIS